MNRPRKTGWQNWSGVQTCAPQHILYPNNENELARIVKESKPGVRAVGASHSFSALVPTAQTLVSLDRMRGVIETDPDTHQATCWAGTPLKELGELLWNAGLSLSVQGDVDHQTLGGAVGTGTHGTGTAFSCMSASVVGFRLLRADGTFINCDADENAEVFHGGRISLGSLGIMSRIRIQCEPAFYLRQRVECVSLSECLHQSKQLNEKHRHVEFFGFPCADRVVLETQDKSTDPATRPPPDLDDFFLWLFSESARLAPPISRFLQRTAMRWIPTERRVDRAYKIFPSTRSVRFNEVEYALPPEKLAACYQELLEIATSHKLCFGFPFECRWVKGDNIWLSPFYQRDAVVLSVHRYYKRSFRAFFDAVERVFWEHDGRPHWGKMHTLNADRFSEMYPRWTDFCDLRNELDPSNKFLNPHLENVFGV